MSSAPEAHSLELKEFDGGVLYFETAGRDLPLAEIPAKQLFAEEVAPPSGTCRLIVDYSALVAQLDELSGLLEGLPQPLIDELFARCADLLGGLALRRLPAAASTGDDFVIGELALPGLDEVLAAARAAREHQFHGSTPRG